MAGPLTGLRVLDLGTRIAAPFCAGLLGEQGAEVIKIEQPGTGDFMREIGPFVDDGAEDSPGYSLFWAVEGRGRKSVTLNLRTAEGQDLFRRLAATADVVVENFRPGTLEKWHIAPTDLDDSRHLGAHQHVRPGRSVLAAPRPRPPRHRVRRAAPPHRVPGPAAGARGRHDLRLPDRRVRGPGRDRGALLARRPPRRQGCDRSTPRSTARRCASSSGRSPPTTSSGWCAVARGQPAGQQRAARQLPHRRRQVRVHRRRLGRQLLAAVPSDGSSGPGRGPAVRTVGRPRGEERRDQRHRRRVDERAQRDRARGRVRRATTCRSRPRTPRPTCSPTRTSPPAAT